MQDLELLRTRVTDAFVLMNDLDLAGVTFEYVPVFHGSIDGQGHAIRNWTYVDGGATFGLGFIGALDGGTLKHLRFTNAKLTSTSAARVGLLVGQAFDGARVHDVHVEGTVTASGPSGWAIGGLIGYVAGFEVTLCGSGTPHGVGVLVSSSSANTTLLTPDSTHSFITAGGLVGGSGNGQTLAVVSNSFAIGSMAGARAAWSGGIVGGYGGGYAGITIFRSYANVVAGPGLQGIAELVALFGAVTASFWELNAAGATESVAGGTGLSPAQMRTAAPFLSAGWSTAAWKFVPGSAPSIADHPPPPPRTVSCGGGLMAEYAALCPRNVDFSGVVDGTNCP